jgi:hypothetical protein
MPDWRSEVRRAIADLKLDAGREEGMVEELAQGLSERYEEMLRSGMDEKQAVWLLKTDLEDGRLIAELRRVHSPASEPIPPGVDNGEGHTAGAAFAADESGLCDCGNSVAGAGNWSEHGDF